MKTMGLIGGMTWESTVEYYRIINELTSKKLGGYHSCRCILYSVDFDDIFDRMHQGRWHEIEEHMLNIAQHLETSGADFIVVCTNTIHKVVDNIRSKVNIPFLHIAEATGDKAAAMGIGCVGLLGTKFTMTEDFYKKTLRDKYNLKVVVPDEDDMNAVHRIITEELSFGVIKDNSRNEYINIIGKLKSMGAEGVILGCTEIPLLIKQKDTDIPVFDTTAIHAEAAVDFALI